MASMLDGLSLSGERQRVSITVTSDTSCCWCYIAIKNLFLAVKRTKEAQLPVYFDVELKPFRLDRCLPPGVVVDRAKYYVCRMGLERASALHGMITEQAEKLGINIVKQGPMRRTGPCHRLLRHAWYVQSERQICKCSKAAQDLALQVRLFEEIGRVFFEEGQDIGDHEVLGQCAEKVGLMTAAEAVTLLDSSAYEQEVEDMIDVAQESGIRGVPHVCINNRWAIVGLQPPEVFENVFRQIAEGAKPQCVQGAVDASQHQALLPPGSLRQHVDPL